MKQVFALLFMFLQRQLRNSRGFVNMLLTIIQGSGPQAVQAIKNYMHAGSKHLSSVLEDSQGIGMEHVKWEVTKLELDSRSLSLKEKIYINLAFVINIYIFFGRSFP